jgi:hypothetical protein
MHAACDRQAGQEKRRSLNLSVKLHHESAVELVHRGTDIGRRQNGFSRVRSGPVLIVAAFEDIYLRLGGTRCRRNQPSKETDHRRGNAA